MKISNCLIDYVANADEHTKLSSVEYSTDLRSIVPIGYMVQRYQQEKENAESAPTQTA